jgi:NitT/TauT family transport system ATP-binding protein
VSFNAKKGTTTCLVGASGCGKTTLLNILAGILPREVPKSKISGRLTIDGDSSEHYLKRGTTGIMFQQPELLEHMTVFDNVALPIAQKKSFSESTVSEMLKTVGLSSRSRSYPSKLSGGMRTRVSLARAFVNSPKLLLMDEPFSSLDAGWQSELYVALGLLQKRCATTIVLVSHSLDEALLLSDKIVVLAQHGSVENQYVRPSNGWDLVESRATLLGDILASHPASNSP